MSFHFATPWLLSLLLTGCLILGLFALTAHRFTSGQGGASSGSTELAEILSKGGVPLDDAWIHFQFARNLARGDGLSFNPGQPTSGSTAACRRPPRTLVSDTNSNLRSSAPKPRTRSPRRRPVS